MLSAVAWDRDRPRWSGKVVVVGDGVVEVN